MAYTSIDDPSEHFHSQLYTGTGSSHSVTNDANAGDFKPDWVWIKERSSSGGHKIYDSTRGVQQAIQSQSTGAEVTTAQGLTAFNTDGFTVGSDGGHNQNNATYVAWQWIANGGTTASNTDGTITSTTQVNSDAGFSIQTFSSASSGNSNWGHGLGSTPDFFMVKRRNGSSSWWVNQTGMTRSGNNWQYIALNNDGQATTLSAFNADSSTITSSNDFVPNSATMLCYAFKNVQGFSKFGRYRGTGNVNGAFIYTGFKPAFVLLKQTSGNGNGWFMFDTARNPINRSTNEYVRADESGAAGTTSKIIDMYSNGFKIINADSAVNGYNHTYIYMAFAENPFVTSGGVPTTAL